MKIIFFSVVKYPTDKAYGVTIGYTCQALIDLGHEALIKTTGDLIHSVNRSRRLLLLLVEKMLAIQFGSGFLGKVTFTFKRLLVAMNSHRVIPCDAEVLWIRDSLVGIFYLRKNKSQKIVLEVHQHINFIERYLLKRILLDKNVYLAPISRELENKLISMQVDLGRLILSPMAVPDAFFSKKVNADVDLLPRGKLNIGYIGGALSLGLDQNLFSLVNCIQEISSSSKVISPRLYIFGIEPDIDKIISINLPDAVTSGLIQITKRQSHDILIHELDICNIFILPYPENKYFSVRFPIKAMEYAALRRPIVISNTKSHRNIFSNKEVWFFEPDKCSNLEEVFLEIYRNPREVSKRVSEAFKKSLDYTYQNRVLRILLRLQAGEK